MTTVAQLPNISNQIALANKLHDASVSALAQLIAQATALVTANQVERAKTAIAYGITSHA